MSVPINQQLAEKEITPLHGVLLEFVRLRVKNSRAMMSNYYQRWDVLWDTYKGVHVPDAQDKEAAKQGLPTKMVVPMTRAQINSFVAFSFMLLRQKDNLFEYEGVSDSDKTWKDQADKIVARDQKKSNGTRLLWQFLHNVAIFGIGIQKDHWVKKVVNVPTAQPSADGKQVITYQSLTAFEGNEITNISPYRFYPDPGFALADWAKGSFVASETEMSRASLKGLEAQGVVHGIEHVENIRVANGDQWARKGMRSCALDWAKPEKNKDVISVTDMYVIDLVPADVKVSDTGEALGRENFSIPYIVWVANDNRVIRCEPSYYLHGQFPYSVGLFSPDDNTQLSGGLAEDIDALQRIISWFLNSRIAAVSRTLDNQFIVDPSGVELATIESRSRAILLKRSAARTDVRRYVTQLTTQDTTTGHVSDANNMISIMQMITGVNDNAMGQYNGGRRSATEARSVVQGAASRMKVIIDLLWEMAFAPQGNRLLLNHRQSLSFEQFVAVVGEENQELYQTFHQPAAKLVGSYDALTYDGSLPSEKGFLAQSMQELLGLLLQNPMASLQFNIDPKKILKTIYSLRGVGQLTQFQYDPNDPTLAALAQAGATESGTAPEPGAVGSA